MTTLRQQSLWILYSVSIVTILFCLLPFVWRPEQKRDSIISASPSHQKQSIDPEKRIELRLGAYSKRLEQLSTIVTQMVVLILISTSICLARGSEVRVPMLDVTISYTVFYVLLSSAMLFLWFQFGFLFHATINERIGLMMLFEMTGEMRPPSAVNDMIDHNLFSILNDGGFVDVYFRSNLPSQIVGVPTEGFARMGATIAGGLIYGAVFGTLHALILVMILLEWHRGWHYKLHFAAVFILLAGSHLQFCYSGRNNNSFQHFIIGIALLALWGLASIATVEQVNKQETEKPD